MARFIDPVTLTGPKVAQLEPMRTEHADALQAAAQDGELADLWYTGVGGADGMTSYVASALKMRDEAGAMPFTVRRQEDGKAVGSTRFFNVDEKNRRLEIGHTWYSKSMHRTALNTECKLIMLTHAFEQLNCIAVEFRTHWFNFDSRAAIARLGAKQDGVLRNHLISPNGTLRDTVVFSIIHSEWPTVKAHLHWQLEKPRA